MFREEFGSSYTYDADGNIVSGGAKITAEAVYSSDGNRLEKTVDALDKVTKYCYNEDTNVLEWVQYPEDTEATRTEYSYDTMYRLASAAADTDTGLALSASYTYADDLLTAIQTPSTTYRFTYGDFAQISSVSVGWCQLASYTYTDDQNRYLEKLTYGNSDSITYTYDDQGRVIKETYEDGDTVTYTYDNTGALATVTDSESGITTTYYYDLTDRMMKYVETGTNYSHSVGYEYDALNNLTKLVETINGIEHSTVYTYDEDNRVTAIINGNTSREYTYDSFGRVNVQTTKHGDTAVLTDSVTFRSAAENTTSGQIQTYRTVANGYDITYSYTYDDNGNITSVFDGTNTVTYAYDSYNQLIRENNPIAGKSWTFAYDFSGNLYRKTEYAYTTGTLGTALNTVNYSCGDPEWGDALTSIDGTQITRDNLGNPLSDGEWEYSWQHGRQLEEMSGADGLWQFLYDVNGMRTLRTDYINYITYRYVYNGSQLTQMSKNNDTLYFAYDAAGTPLSFTYGTATYYYVTNLQGDVVAILDSTGTPVVSYTYNAWGKVLSVTGSMASTLGYLNPLTYRGYIYDWETGLYYLQSRYYNPEWGRFINADAFVSTGQGFIGNNMFAYCNNNPIMFRDSSGCMPVAVYAEDYAGWVGEQVGNWLSGLIYETDTGDKLREVGNSFFENLQISVGFGFGLYGGVEVADTIGVSGGIIGDLFNVSLIDGETKVTQKIFSGIEAEVAKEDFDFAEEVYRDFFGGQWAEDPSRDGLSIFGAGVYFIVGGSFSVAFDLGAFWNDLVEIFD